MKEIIHNGWQEVLSSEFSKDYYLHPRGLLRKGYATRKIHSDIYHICEALELTPYEEVKVVILGQDSYRGENQAHGLSLSVQSGARIPPSLRNIYKELHDDLGIVPVQHGSLVSWAEQGVLLPNTVLTVREGRAYPHRGKGWGGLIDTTIEKLNEREKPIVFALWEEPAQEKIEMIDKSRHIIITSPYPSPLSASRGFFGSKPFSETNDALPMLREEPVGWQSPETV